MLIKAFWLQDVSPSPILKIRKDTLILDQNFQ